MSLDPRQRLTAVEFYAGIGGFAAAVSDLTIDIQLAVDIDSEALAIYAANFPHPTCVAEIESFDFGRTKGDLWWLSPPCRPFTRRGRQRGLDDVRTKSMIRVIDAACDQLPAMVALENVPPFADSQACRQIKQKLRDAGYAVEVEVRCPSELGIPNRRRRAYLLAQQGGLQPLAPAAGTSATLKAYLDKTALESLSLDPQAASRYAAAIDTVDPGQQAAETACFTSAYGKSPVRSGSYLRSENGLRHFSPREVARLLGFPDRFQFPATVSLRRQYHLLGNSVSLPVVRWMLSRFGL